MASSNNAERRIAFLERVYLEDRKRWATAKKLFSDLYRQGSRHEGELKRHGNVLEEMITEVKRQGERQEAMMKLLYRLLER